MEGEETKVPVKEESPKEAGKSEVEKSEMPSVAVENPVNLVEPSLPTDSEMAESAMNVETREAICEYAHYNFYYTDTEFVGILLFRV